MLAAPDRCVFVYYIDVISNDVVCEIFMNYFAVIITCILFDFLARVILFVTGYLTCMCFRRILLN